MKNRITRRAHIQSAATMTAVLLLACGAEGWASLILGGL